MTRTILALLLTGALATQAQALSCAVPSVQAAFDRADGADVDYVLAVGRLALLPGETVPKQTGDPDARQGYSVRAQFTGRLASATGFDAEASFPLTVEVECAGPWCGGVPLGRKLVFVERRGEDYVLVQGPCPFFALDATPAAERAAMACATGGDCAAPE